MTTINDLQKAFGWGDEQAGPKPIGEPGAPKESPEEKPDKKTK
jgi:hypothetical protein